MLADKNATETSGECYGFSFLYSGNFLAAAEKDQFDQTRLIMGIHPENFEFLLREGEIFPCTGSHDGIQRRGLRKNVKLLPQGSP